MTCFKPHDGDWHECPFCEVLFASDKDLCDHVFSEHRTEMVNGRQLVDEVWGEINCWCGESFNVYHIMEKGGMVAHVLDLIINGRTSDESDGK